MSNSYYAMYKCRMCHKIFPTKKESSSTASIYIYSLTHNPNNDDNDEIPKIPMSLYSNHICKDGNYGFADFVGFYKVAEE